MAVEILPVPGLPEFAPGDDLGAVVADALAPLPVLTGDVVAVTQKVVSKSEGRLVEGEDRGVWVERESRRVVARRGDLVIAETRHGFVCANAGVDASNVADGWLSLLPEDPDASAARIRDAVAERVGADVGVVITDTFGRPWREGVVNVAIGAAGLPSLVDLRGTKDHHGRDLDATVVALADEIAAASGLVMGKAAGVPVAVVRGVDLGQAPLADARALVRRPEDDLFRAAPLWFVRSAGEATSLAPRDVPRPVLEEAIAAAAAREAPLAFVVATSLAARTRIAAAIAGDAAADRLVADGGALIVPLASFAGAGDADARSSILLSCGAAIERLGLALEAQAFGWAWIRRAIGREDAARAAVGADADRMALGVVAVGETRTRAAPPRPPSHPSVVRFE